MNGVFITGTGTDVGKTHVTGLLLAALRVRGVNAVSVKPVQTGCAPGGVAPDLEEHWRLAGWRPDETETLAPYRFFDPVSPHLAARRAGRTLSVDAIELATRQAAEGYAFALVEGAGGLLVPLNEAENMRDLAEALALPVVVVAEAGLGTINHTLLTIEALRTRDLPILCVVLNENRPVDRDLANDNAHAIALWTGLPVLGPLAHGATDFSSVDPLLMDALVEMAGQPD